MIGFTTGNLVLCCFYCQGGLVIALKLVVVVVVVVGKVLNYLTTIYSLFVVIEMVKKFLVIHLFNGRKFTKTGKSTRDIAHKLPNRGINYLVQELIPAIGDKE